MLIGPLPLIVASAILVWMEVVLPSLLTLVSGGGLELRLAVVATADGAGGGGGGGSWETCCKK